MRRTDVFENYMLDFLWLKTIYNFFLKFFKLDLIFFGLTIFLLFYRSKMYKIFPFFLEPPMEFLPQFSTKIFLRSTWLHKLSFINNQHHHQHRCRQYHQLWSINYVPFCIPWALRYFAINSHCTLVRLESLRMMN